MKRLVLSGAAVLFALAFAAPAPAQGTGGFQFGLSGGVSVPTGDTSGAFDDGYHGGLVLNYELPALPLGLRVDGDYRHFSSGSSSSAQVVDGNANLVVGIRIVVVKVYALAGAGVYNVEFSGTDTKTGASTSSSQTQFGWNAGAGAAFVVGKLSIFAEGRYHEVSLDAAQGPPKFKFVAVSAGILF